MKTFTQLIREFAIPFVVALLWVLYILATNRGEQNFAGATKAFSTSFFFAAWATGQFVRVSRQSRTDSSLKNVEQRVNAMIDSLDLATRRVVNSTTGGDAFARILIRPNGNVFVCHFGEFPLSNMQIRICDLHLFEASMAAGNPLGADHYLTVDELNAGMGFESDLSLPMASPSQDWNVFYSARNGTWTQMIRSRQVAGSRLFASITCRNIDGQSVTLESLVDHGFPLIGDPEFDAAERRPPA